MMTLTLSKVLCIFAVFLVQANGFMNGWYSSTTYTEVSEVSPERVAARLAPKMNEMAVALVNAEKKSTEELEQFTSEYIQNLSRSFSDDLKGEAKNLKEILRAVIETRNMAETRSDELHKTKQVIDKTKGEIDRVEGETFAIYDLLVKIVDTMDKEEEMWTTAAVLRIVVPLGTLAGILLLAIMWLVYRQYTRTERKLQWLSFCVNAESRFKDDLGTNDKANFDINYTKKNLEYVNPLVTKGPDF